MKKTAITGLKIGVSLALYAYIFASVDVARLWSQLKTANLSLFVLAVLSYLAIQSLSAYRWCLLLAPQRLSAPYRRLLSIYFMGMFFNWFLPTAIGGDVVRVYYLNKETRRLSGATASVFLDRDLGMAALLLVALAVTLTDGTRLSVPEAGLNGVLLAPLFALVTAAFAAANLALFYRPSYNLLHRFLRLFRLKRADERVQKLFDSVNSYRGRWGLLGGAMGLSVVIQLGGIVANVMLAASIGIVTTNGWLDFLVLIPAVSLISMAPLSVNGMGWREISYIVLFQTVGATEPQAAALAFLWLGVLFTTSLPGGVIYILRGATKKLQLSSTTVAERAPENEPVSTI
jgi:uncharacterized protein (TIRG00374 family)